MTAEEKRLKTLTGLECCLEQRNDCRRCPYYRHSGGCITDLLADARSTLLALSARAQKEDQPCTEA